MAYLKPTGTSIECCERGTRARLWSSNVSENVSLWHMNKFLRVVVSLITTTAASGIATGSASEPSVERLDATHVMVTWPPSRPVDVFETDRPDTDTSKAKRLSRDDRDGRYVAAVTDRRRSYFLLRDALDGSVVRVSERVLPLERGSNFRDLGGYATVDGKHVRWGLIYRSGATPLLSDHDVSYLRTLGLRSMIDLRSTEERELAPTRLSGQGIRYVAIDYPFNSLFTKGITHATVPKPPPSASTLYRDFLTVLAREYGAVFHELLSRTGPIVYNCTAGQDRTGIATALILSALGVSRETILHDFHLSTGYRHPENEMPLVDPTKHPGNPAAELFVKARQAKPAPLYSTEGHSLLVDTFDEIHARWGSFDLYLEQVLGIDSGQLTALRAYYLE